jgi:predicted ferric reductase
MITRWPGIPSERMKAVRLLLHDTRKLVILGSFVTLLELTKPFRIAMIASGLLIPIVFSLLRFAPLPHSLVTRVLSYLIFPATWGSKHRTPIGGNVGICPTRGQSLFIFFLCTLNFLLCVATHRFVPIAEQTKFKTNEDQLLTGMGNRIGHLCLVNLALMTLFAGRNNFLLWITKWQRATFLLFHHWLGYIVILEGSIHASIYLHIYLTGNGDDVYSVENKEPYWIWGTVGVLSMCITFPLTMLRARQKAYELFLASHRLLALLILIGVFLHTFLKNGSKGYHNWVISTFAALGFDYLMRFIRIARNGLLMAEITVIDEEYIRVDVKGPSAEGHAFIYFPTLTWRFWESHPFSVAASVHDYLPFHAHKISNSSSGSITPDETSDPEKGTLAQTSGKEINISSSSPPEAKSDSSTTLPARPSAGVTFFIRRQSGLTSLLGSRLRLPVLMESSYGSLSDVSRSPNLITIAGGVGIVTVLPILRTHPGRTKLYWSIRTSGLLDALSEDIKGVDREVSVGSRMNVEEILEREIGGRNGKGACVVVSGPAGLADEVRRVVVRLGKRKDAWPVKFIDESFS